MFGTEEQKEQLPAPLRTQRDQRVPAHRAGRRHRPGPPAAPPPPRTATTTSSTASSCGPPTAWSPTCSSSWPRCPRARGTRAGSPPSSCEADSPGITVENRNAFMGLRGIENGVTRLHQVRVPAANRIGREGEGLKIALTTLNTGRLSLPARVRGQREVVPEDRPRVVERSACSGASRSASTRRSPARSRSSRRPPSRWRRWSTCPARWPTRTATTSGSRPRWPSCTAPRWPG